MANLCVERYNCNSCCKDTFVWMTMREFAIFAQAWIRLGLPVVQARSKDKLIQSGPYIAQNNPGKLFYASNRRLDEHRETGRFGNTRVIAIFNGICANNDIATGNCSIEKNKPKDCQEFRFEGGRCKQIRVVNSINPSNFIPIDVISWQTCCDFLLRNV